MGFTVWYRDEKATVKSTSPKFRKIAEIIAIPPNDTKKVLEYLENTGLAVLEDHNHPDGDHFIVMEKIE